jgi:hypothetical protein
MKDFFDLWVMCRAMTFEGAVLAKALAATFERRRTPLPADAPPALKVEFGREAVKRTQWAAFLRKNELVDEMEELTRVVELLDIFLMAPALAAGKGQSFKRLWPPGGPWAEKERGSD